MNERERLIELLCNVDCNGADRREGGCSFRQDSRCNVIQKLDMCMVETIADHLLTNGVIVPPCKVGDTVYHVYKGNTIVNALVEDWKKEAFGDCLFRAYFSVNGSSIILLFGDNNIGKTVFLTRDDAEKALEWMQ